MQKSSPHCIILSLDLKALKFNVLLTIEGDLYYVTLGIELPLSVSCSHTNVGENYSDKNIGSMEGSGCG